MELFWVFWFIVAVILVAGTFGVAEAYAIRNKKSTLSRTMWEIGKSWPPFGWAVGMGLGLLIGFLACHFFWPGEGCSIGVLH